VSIIIIAAVEDAVMEVVLIPIRDFIFGGVSCVCTVYGERGVIYST